MKVHFNGGTIYKTFVIVPTIEVTWDIDAISIGISFMRWTGYIGFFKKESYCE